MSRFSTRWHTYGSAAKRTKSSTRTIQNWRRNGMPMAWQLGSDGQQERVVREDILLAWWRDRMTANPVHFFRRRSAAREAGLPDPVRPNPATRRPKPLEPAEPEPERYPTVDPLSDMVTMGGRHEYSTLLSALNETETGCRGVDAYTADTVDPEELPVLASICSRCPVLELCRAYAVAASPVVGVWAGVPAREFRTVANAA